jgi:hypothetical protein
MHCCHLPGTLALQFTGPHCNRLFFYRGIWKLKFLLTSLTLTALKMQFVRRLRMLRSTLSVASWPVYLGDGSNALTVMEDISKTLYWRREAFFVNPRHWLTLPCSVVFIAVYNKCVILLSKWVTLNATPYVYVCVCVQCLSVTLGFDVEGLEQVFLLVSSSAFPCQCHFINSLL